ncbi:MAG: Rrf2 family transcriptional regulator [Chloroflexi bacterium]|nr:Rrf2 family transcriptional regulator [Chloroflexota bacterium]
MKVSTRVHYGLRAMTELSQAHGHGLISLAEIARTEMLPLAYLEQLIGELRRAGLVEGVRGLHGGYRLTRPPVEITVGEVYRVLEGPIAPVECTAEGYLPHSCEREEGCRSRSVWARVQESISAVLDSTTLADLCQGGPAPTESGLIAIETITGARASVKEGCLKTP